MSTHRITSHDVARLVGVSQSTVSRALRGHPAVTAATTERVRAGAEQLGYFPNLAARSLMTARTQTIGVVVANITNPFYPQLVEVLHDELGRGGYRTVLVNTDQDPGALLRGGVDGAVLVSETLGSETAATLAASGIPAVLLNRHNDNTEFDVVACDNVSGGAAAAAFLAGLGHGRIGLIAGPENTSTGRDRERGVREELKRRGSPLDERLRRAAPYSHQGGYGAGLELLGLPDRPTAIICGNDIIAFGVIDAARRRRVAVPGEISIIGFDDVEMAGWEVFRLTTIRQPLPAMARAAALLLLERVESTTPMPPRRRIFPGDLVVRATTSPPNV